MKKLIIRALSSLLVISMIAGALFLSVGNAPQKASALYEGEEDASCLETVDSLVFYKLEDTPSMVEAEA
jgi:hypothetical protein